MRVRLDLSGFSVAPQGQPTALDRALLAAAALADEGDAAVDESLRAQGEPVPFSPRGEARFVPAYTGPDAEDIRLAARTYVGRATLDGEDWILLQTSRQNRLLLRGDEAVYEGRRAALFHSGNVVGRFFAALLAGRHRHPREIPVLSMESQDSHRPWWAVHSLPPAWVPEDRMGAEGVLRLGPAAHEHLGTQIGEVVYLARQAPGEVLLMSESRFDEIERG